MHTQQTAAIEVARDDEMSFFEPITHFGADVETAVSPEGQAAIVWTEGDEFRSVDILGQPEWAGDAYTATGAEPGVTVRVRALDPYDGITLAPKAGVPQPMEVLRAAVSQGGGVVAQELTAVVAADNTVVTLMLETEIGTYVRFSGDWQLLGDNSEALDDTWTLTVSADALGVFDAADMASATLSAFDLPRTESVDGVDIQIDPEPVGMESGTLAPELSVVVAAGAAIPSILSEDDLDIAIRFAQNNPAARWYVTKRADAMGQSSRVPTSWSPGGNRPFDGVLSKGQDGVRTAALAMAAAMSTGTAPDPQEYAQLLRAARREGMWEHEALVAARRWREWLHPRGRDGRFIHKIGSLLNVFASSNSSSSDPKAKKRRAMITRFEPEGVRVVYYDNYGKRVPASPEEGYPELIPTDEFSKKAILAPPHVARIETEDGSDRITPEDVIKDAVDAATPIAGGLSFDEYNQRVEEFNQKLRETPPPGASANGLDVALTLDSEAWADHKAYVENVIDRIEAGSLTTALLQDSRGDWSPEVFELVDTVVRDMLEDIETRRLPKDRKAVVLGGLPGAGKTTSIDNNAVLLKAGLSNPDRWVQVNSDEMKTKIADLGVFTEFEGLGPLESATAVHQLSSLMGEIFGRALIADGYNVIFDTTLGHTVDGRPSFAEDIEELKHFGYDVDGVFVDTPVDTAKGRRDSRWMDGVNEQNLENKGRGGRYVPDYVYQSPTRAVDQNRQNFDYLTSSESFDRWIVLSGEDRAAEPIISQGRGTETIDNPSNEDYPGVF